PGQRHLAARQDRPVEGLGVAAGQGSLGRFEHQAVGDDGISGDAAFDIGCRADLDHLHDRPAPAPLDGGHALRPLRAVKLPPVASFSSSRASYGSTNSPPRATPFGTRAPSVRIVSVEMWRGDFGKVTTPTKRAPPATAASSVSGVDSPQILASTGMALDRAE